MESLHFGAQIRTLISVLRSKKSRSQQKYHIKGTITPIDFVKKTLFPYSNDHFDEFISNEVISDVFHYVNGDCPLAFKPNFEMDDSKEGCLKVLR